MNVVVADEFRDGNVAAHQPKSGHLRGAPQFAVTDSEQTGFQDVAGRDLLYSPRTHFRLARFGRKLASTSSVLCRTFGHMRLVTFRRDVVLRPPQIHSSVSFLRRILELWSYVFIVVSVAGVR